jgi:hypothetical protein
VSIYKELVDLILPGDILKYFDVIEFKKEAVELRIFLEEKKDPPEKNTKTNTSGLMGSPTSLKSNIHP